MSYSSWGWTNLSAAWRDAQVETAPTYSNQDVCTRLGVLPDYALLEKRGKSQEFECSIHHRHKLSQLADIKKIGLVTYGLSKVTGIFPAQFGGFKNVLYRYSIKSSKTRQIVRLERLSGMICPPGLAIYPPCPILSLEHLAPRTIQDCRSAVALPHAPSNEA